MKGDLLMFQPKMGCLSLNLDVTKSLFQAFGEKLTVRQRSQQEEVLTIFLPREISLTKANFFIIRSRNIESRNKTLHLNITFSFR